MNEKIKYILWKFLIVTAIAVFYSGFGASADAEQPEMSAENTLNAANKQPNEKPVFRCPKISFLARTSCHQIKPVKAPSKTDEWKISPEKEKADRNQNSPSLLPQQNQPPDIFGN